MRRGDGHRAARRGGRFLPREALRLRLSSSQKNSGAKITATIIDARMPPITPVPIARRLLAPARSRSRAARSRSRTRATSSRWRAGAHRPPRCAASRAAMPCAHVLDRDLADEDRVLRRKPDQRDQADLEVDVVLEPDAPRSAAARRARDRHGQHHRDRQRPLLELRGEQQEHEDQAER